jgi:toxin ParE1/3/4
MVHAVILPRAQADIDETAAYIAGDNVRAGLGFLTALGAVCVRLTEMPRLGRVCVEPSPRGAEIRCCPVKGFANWLVFYRPQQDRIEIIRVLHGARDVGTILADEITDPPTDQVPEE